MWNTSNGGYGGQPSTENPFFNPTATHAYSVFNDFNHSQQATNGLKKIHLTDDATNPDLKHITIIGNFGVTTQNINPMFQKTGTCMIY